ncbi:MAG: tetratricopeptide repeat protein [Candidatus Aminicenantes bacterium]|nr:tetratricopeptide repeat protein [Candidatus Aminicenantes bacterium]
MLKRNRTAAILGMVLLLSTGLLSQSDEEGKAIFDKNKESVISFVALNEDDIEIARGTGWMIGKDVMITNYHLVSGAKKAEGIDVNGKKVKVDGIISFDKKTNLAVVKAKSKAPALKMGNFADVKFGSVFYIVAANEAGEISSYSGKVINLAQDKAQNKVADTSISAPDSACGGPVFDATGQLVGILVFIDGPNKFVVPVGHVQSLSLAGKGIKFKSQDPIDYFTTEEGIYYAANMFSAIESTSKASKFLKEYLKFKPDDLDTYVTLAYIQTKQRDFSAAASSYNKVIELDPNRDGAYLGLGKVYTNMRKWAEAIGPLERAVQMNQDHIAAYALIGKAYKEQRIFDKATEAYEKYLGTNPKAPGESHQELAECYMELKQFEDAVRIYQIAVKIDPQNVRLNYKLAQAHQDAGQVDEAAAVYATLIDLSPEDAKVYFNTMIRMYDEAQMPDKAVEIARRQVEMEPENSEAVYNVGAMLLKQKNFTEAATAFEKAIELDPNFEYAYLNLGFCYSQVKDYNQAIATFEKFTGIVPDNDQGWFNLGINYMQLKQWSKAATALLKATELKPDNDYAYYNLAIAYLNLKDNFSAREVHKKLQGINPELADRLQKYLR